MIAEMSDMSVSMTFKTKKLVLQMQLRVSNGMILLKVQGWQGEAV